MQIRHSEDPFYVGHSREIVQFGLNGRIAVLLPDDDNLTVTSLTHDGDRNELNALSY